MFSGLTIFMSTCNKVFLIRRFNMVVIAKMFIFYGDFSEMLLREVTLPNDANCKGIFASYVERVFSVFVVDFSILKSKIIESDVN